MVRLIRTDRKAAGCLHAAYETLQSFRVHEFDRLTFRERNRVRAEARRRHNLCRRSTLIDHHAVELAHYLHGHRLAFPSLALHHNGGSILAKQ
jgi:hypothetical protein